MPESKGQTRTSSIWYMIDVNRETFERKLAEAKVKFPGAFKLAAPDPPASAAQVRNLEETLAVSLEESHKDFLMAFGGGEIGFEVLFSADAQSEWYLPRQIALARCLPKNYIAITSNFCGDYYGFEAIEGKCVPPLLRWEHETGVVEPTEYQDVFEFMACFALRPA